MITFSCPGCSRRYRVQEDVAGKTARCKDCGAAMPIPRITDPPDSAPSTADVHTAPPGPKAQSAAPPGPSGKIPQSQRTSDHGPPTLQNSDAPRPRNPAAQKDSSAKMAEVLSGSTAHFDYEISQRPDFSMVTITLEQGQKVFAEPSAMASMTPTVTLKAGFKGGLGKTLGRALGGESMIINTFTAEHGPGEVSFAGGVSGDAAYYELAGSPLFLQRGAFMLHSDGVEISGKWQGAKGFFSGQGLVLLKATGEGDIFFNSYGAILSIDVTDEFIVDTGYIVAFEGTLNYDISVLPGLRGGSKLKTLFFGGEGLVCRFTGQGRVWIQTRHVQSFLSWVHPFRPVKSRN
jgi:uncharacterized protein (TIGR00266 family)